MACVARYFRDGTLAAVDRDARFSEQAHRPAQRNKPAADLADGPAIVLAEIGNRLVIGNKPSRQPHDLHVASGLALEPAAPDTLPSLADASYLTRTLDPPSVLPRAQPRPYIWTMHLDLSDDEATGLTQEPRTIVQNDRYPLSPRIRTLRGILANLRPEPVREPLSPPKLYAPPKATAARRRR